MTNFRDYVLVFLGAATAAVSLSAMETERNSGWQLAYAHDAEGNTEEGSKDDLIRAVQQGQQVRIYWAQGRVEHLTDSHFITIFGGEVFAQTPLIRGQRPGTEPTRIDLATGDELRNGIKATNGNRALRWFVQSE